jgi:hypothetical protein
MAGPANVVEGIFAIRGKLHEDDIDGSPTGFIHCIMALRGLNLFRTDRIILTRISNLNLVRNQLYSSINTLFFLHFTSIQ